MLDKFDIMSLMEIFFIARALGIGTSKKSGNGIDRIQSYIHDWMMNHEEEIRTMP